MGNCFTCCCVEDDYQYSDLRSDRLGVNSTLLRGRQNQILPAQNQRHYIQQPAQQRNYQPSQQHRPYKYHPIQQDSAGAHHPTHQQRQDNYYPSQRHRESAYPPLQQHRQDEFPPIQQHGQTHIQGDRNNIYPKKSSWTTVTHKSRQKVENIYVDLSDIALVIVSCKVIEHLMAEYLKLKQSPTATLGSKIKMLSQQNLLTKATIRKLWKINDKRNDLVHQLECDDLTSRSAFQSEFEYVTQEITDGEDLNPSVQKQIENIITASQPAAGTTSDFDVAVKCCKTLEHRITNHFHIGGDSEKTLGDKISVLDGENLLCKTTIKELKRLNYMRRCLLHNYGEDRLIDRTEFINLFETISNTLPEH